MPTIQEVIRNAVSSWSDAESAAAELACVQFLCFGDARVLRRRLREAIGDTATTATVIDDLVTTLRYRLDAKRVFKAIFSILHDGLSVDDASKTYQVGARDLRYVLGYLTPEMRKEFLEKTSAADCAMMDITADFVQPLKRHCDRIVNKARFISKYDPAVSTEDLKQDLMLRGLRATVDYEHMRREDGLSDYDHILNMARSSASSGVKDIIDHYTHESRMRLHAVYTCQACNFTSPNKTETCTECGAAVHTVADRGFNATTYSIDSSPIHWKRKIKIKGTKDEATAHELFQSLSAVLDTVGNRYLLILMREDPGFDAWLAERGRADVEKLSDNQLRNYGADYLGESRTVLDRKLNNALRSIL